MDTNRLLKKIEILRGELVMISKGKSLSDPQVLGASYTLNKYLNQYQKLLNERKSI